MDSSLIERLEEAVARLRDRDVPFVRRERLTRDIKARFQQEGLMDKVELLDTVHAPWLPRRE